MKRLNELLAKSESTPNGNFREDLIEAVKWALHFGGFATKIDNEGNLIIASDEQENEVLDCIFDNRTVQEVIAEIERTTKNLVLFKSSKGSEVAPSMEFARKKIFDFIKSHNLKADGYFSVVPGRCECGETQLLTYDIYEEGFLSVNFCEICGVDDAYFENYVNINC